MNVDRAAASHTSGCDARDWSRANALCSGRRKWRRPARPSSGPSHLDELWRRRLEVAKRGRMAADRPVDREAVGADCDGFRGEAEQARRPQLDHAGADAPARARYSSRSLAASASLPDEAAGRRTAKIRRLGVLPLQVPVRDIQLLPGLLRI